MYVLYIVPPHIPKIDLIELNMNKCLNCNKEFEAKRASAKYCSAKCRKLAFHKNALSVPELEKRGEWVPNWKRNGCKSRKEVDSALMAIIEQFPTCKWVFKGYVIKQQ